MAGAAASLAVAAAVALTGAAPAQAAVADVWAFAYSDNAAPPPGWVMDTTRQSGTFRTACPSAWATVTSPSVGVYQVLFPCSAAYGGIVHVTAVDSAGNFCEAGRWLPYGRSQLVYVFCFDAAGAAANTRFTVLFTTSSVTAVAGAHAYTFDDPAGTTITSFNSNAGAVTSAQVGTGVYRVRMAGVAPSTYIGDLQATAVQPGQTARRCRVADLARPARDYVVYVVCTDWSGNNSDSYFTLSFHHKRAVFGALAPPYNMGYVLAGAPWPDTNYNSVNGPNVVTPFAAGQWDVTFPDVATGATHMQVTAFGGRPAYCQLSDVWTSVGTDIFAHTVACFRPGGAPVENNFFATYSSDR
jgi:hypothetical protein